MTEVTIDTYICPRTIPVIQVTENSYANALSVDYNKDTEVATVDMKIAKPVCLSTKHQRLVSTRILPAVDADGIAINVPDILNISCSAFAELVGDPSFKWSREVTFPAGGESEEATRNRWLTLEFNHPEAVCFWKKTSVEGIRLIGDFSTYVYVEPTIVSDGLLSREIYSISKESTIQLSQTEFVPGELLQLMYTLKSNDYQWSAPVAGDYYETPAITGGEIMVETLSGFAIQMGGYLVECVPTDWANYHIGDWAYCIKQWESDASECDRSAAYNGMDTSNLFDVSGEQTSLVRIVPMIVNGYGCQNKGDEFHALNFSTLTPEDFSKFFELSINPGIVTAVDHRNGTVDVEFQEGDFSGELYKDIDTHYHCEGGIFDEHASAFDIGDEILVMNEFGHNTPEVENLTAIGFTDGVKPCGRSVVLISNHTGTSACAFDMETEEIIVGINSRSTVIKTLNNMGMSARVEATHLEEFIDADYNNYEWDPGYTYPTVGIHYTSFFPHGEYVEGDVLEETALYPISSYINDGMRFYETYKRKYIHHKDYGNLNPYIIVYCSSGLADNFDIKSCSPLGWDSELQEWIPYDVMTFTRIYYHGLFHQDTLADYQANGLNCKSWMECLWDSWEGFKITNEISGELHSSIPEDEPEEWWCCTVPDASYCLMDKVPMIASIPDECFEIWKYDQWTESPVYTGPVTNIPSVFSDIGMAENGVTTLLCEQVRVAGETDITWGYDSLENVKYTWIPILRFWAKMTNILSPEMTKLKEAFNTAKIVGVPYQENISLVKAAETLAQNMADRETVTFVDINGNNIFGSTVDGSNYILNMLKVENGFATVVQPGYNIAQTTLLLDPNGTCAIEGGGARVYGIASGFDLTVYTTPRTFYLPLFSPNGMTFFEHTGYNITAEVIVQYLMQWASDYFGDSDMNEIGLASSIAANGKTYICILLGTRCNIWPGFAAIDTSTELLDYVNSNFDWSDSEDKINPLRIELI